MLFNNNAFFYFTRVVNSLAKNFIQKYWGSIKRTTKSINVIIKTIGVTYVSLLAVLIISYFVKWCFSVELKGTGTLAELLALITVMFSTQVIGALAFLCGLSIDRDGNGVSDVIDKTLEKTGGLLK